MKNILVSIVFFLFLHISGFSQIARELESTKVVQNESQDSGGLLDDYFQLSHKSYLMERGTSTIYKGENLGNYTISEYFEYYLYKTGKIEVLAKGYFLKFVTLNGLIKEFTKKYYNTTAYDMRSVDYKFINKLNYS